MNMIMIMKTNIMDSKMEFIIHKLSDQNLSSLEIKSLMKMELH